MFVLKNKHTALLKKYHNLLDEIDVVVGKNYELLRKLEAYETTATKKPVVRVNKKTETKPAKKVK